ncbi:MAG: DinB family protein [Candidatus Thorarchaeota archaeon]
MEKQLIKDLASGLIGELTHLHPKRAVEGLTPAIARKKPTNLDHSCWDLLHHTVFWQDILLKNLEGEFMNWYPPHEKNWPSKEYLSNDDNFSGLIDKFNMNLEIAVKKLENIDLVDRIKIGAPLSPDATYFRILLVFLQHTSYHLGQLVTTRKLLGDWKRD